MLIASLTSTLKPLTASMNEKKIDFRAEIKEGFNWLWKHELLRPLTISVGLINGVTAMMGAAFILFAQEVLHTSVLIFAILGTAGAVGGILGGILGPKLAEKIGSGPSITLALIVMPSTSLAIGFMSNWYWVWLLTAIGVFVAVLCNVIIVSLRQSITPTHLLGRVNSVYRFLHLGNCSGWYFPQRGVGLSGYPLRFARDRLALSILSLRCPWAPHLRNRRSKVDYLGN